MPEQHICTEREAMSRIEGKIDDISGMTSLLSTTLDSVRHKLYGNGEIGLFERVREVEKFNSAISKVLWAMALAISGTIARSFLK